MSVASSTPAIAKVATAMLTVPTTNGAPMSLQSSPLVAP
jgi:hypothetical protein